MTSREVLQPNGGIRNVPCYSLTKTECLYVATKFNDEVRAQKFTFSHSHFHILCAAPMIFGGVSANEASFFADAGLQEKQECVDGTCGWRRQKKDALNQGSLVVLQIMTIANERGAHFGHSFTQSHFVTSSHFAEC